MPPLMDQQRGPDADNPRGYFERESVKSLAQQTDKAWLEEGRGKALKVISHLLKELPDHLAYRVLFATRDLDEVIRSQNVLLSRQDQPNPVDDRRARALFRQHLVNVQLLMGSKPNFQTLVVPHRETLNKPLAAARAINAFLGGGLKEVPMAGVVDPTLYRNRA